MIDDEGTCIFWGYSFKKEHGQFCPEHCSRSCKVCLLQILERHLSKPNFLSKKKVKVLLFIRWMPHLEIFLLLQWNSQAGCICSLFEPRGYGQKSRTFCIKHWEASIYWFSTQVGQWFSQSWYERCAQWSSFRCICSLWESKQHWKCQLLVLIYLVMLQGMILSAAVLVIKEQICPKKKK